MTGGRPFRRTATAEDVAALAGVSRSAVSRTFTKGASVAPATREKVLEAARALGYQVNALARSLSSRRSDLVGVVLSDIDNSFRAQMLDAVGRELIASSRRPFFLPTEPGGDVSRHIDLMLHYNVVGAIVIDDASPARIAEVCVAHSVPLVLVNKPVVSPRVANVSHDMAQAGRLAAEALHRCGCRRVVLAAQKRRSFSIAARRAAFLGACRELGMTIAGEFRGPVQNYEGGTMAAEAFLASGVEADGIYCANDYMALGFIDTVRHRGGLRIPGDMKLVACDDIAEAAWLSYDLTTIRQDAEALARAAVASLIGRIETPGIPAERETIEVHVVERGSTRSS